MAYAQHFGLSRNSPLNTHTKYHCGEGSKNSAGECVGWEYNQGEEKRNADKTQANEDLYNLKGPLTDDQQTKRDMMMISAVSKGEKEWGNCRLRISAAWPHPKMREFSSAQLEP